MKAEYVQSLVRAFAKGDRDLFVSIVRQVAAAEKNLERGQFSKRLLESIARMETKGLTPLPKGRDSESAAEVVPELEIGDLVLSPEVMSAVDQFLEEHRLKDHLAAHGCQPAMKLLLEGPPGTGKTALAGGIAKAFGLPFIVAKQHEIVNSFMGESEKAVARLFDFASANRCVFLIDEFDGLGESRSEGTSSAGKTLNSVVTTILQRLDRYFGPSIIIAATNLIGRIDTAITRRFDMTLAFPMPTEEHRRLLIRRTLGDDDGPFTGSHAVIVRDCLREKKRRILANAPASARVPLIAPVAVPSVSSHAMENC